jgi:hypothetical protein
MGNKLYGVGQLEDILKRNPTFEFKGNVSKRPDIFPGLTCIGYQFQKFPGKLEIFFGGNAPELVAPCEIRGYCRRMRFKSEGEEKFIYGRVELISPFKFKPFEKNLPGMDSFLGNTIAKKYDMVISKLEGEETSFEKYCFKPSELITGVKNIKKIHFLLTEIPKEFREIMNKKLR